jgi:hypothetical protein
MKVFDVPTPEELIQKTLSDRGQHEKGIRNQRKVQLERNQFGFLVVIHLCMEAMLGIFLYSYP